jgi:DNA repair protein RecO (recombination protein O)
MHKLFVSEGVVLGKRGVGEANVLLAVLTKDIGLVKAVARSARRESSKLRYALEPLTSATYSFIRGRHEWKLVGAERATAPLRDTTLSLEARQAAGRVTRLLLRLIHGEEENPALFTTVSEGLHALASAPTQTPQIETVLVLRVLSHLGYLPQTPELKPFIERDFFAIELAEEVAASKAILNKAIQDSLNATGL